MLHMEAPPRCCLALQSADVATTTPPLAECPGQDMYSATSDGAPPEYLALIFLTCLKRPSNSRRPLSQTDGRRRRAAGSPLSVCSLGGIRQTGRSVCLLHVSYVGCRTGVMMQRFE